MHEDFAEKTVEKKPDFYPVIIKEKQDRSGDKVIVRKIFGLPKGEDPENYYCRLATLEEIKRLREQFGEITAQDFKYVAVKKTKENSKDYDDWSDKGGKLNPG